MITAKDILSLPDTKATSRKRRSRFDIFAEILQIAIHGEKKTVIMYKANLSYKCLGFYLRLLIESQMLRKSGHTRGSLYKTTSKGASFISLSKELDRILS